MKVNVPAVYKADATIKQTPEIINSDRQKNGDKAKARYPHKPLGNQPGGGGSTSGPFKRAMTPGTTPTGS
jgi:hypothetical protein